MTPTSVMGPMVATMVATARCLVLPQYKLQSLLCAILRDEFMSWHKKVGVLVTKVLTFDTSHYMNTLNADAIIERLY